MSPEGRASIATLARLRAEIASDRSAMRRRLEEAGEVSRLWPQGDPDRGALALASQAVHYWYTGLETLLERVARALDGDVPGGPASHQTLLAQMMVELPGIRPAVVAPSLEVRLRELLGFRHFFRHAYGAEVDPRRLRDRLEDLSAAAPEVDRALDAFDRFLGEAISALQSE